MAAFICRMCGALLELPDERRVSRCKACGVLQSVPFIDTREKQTACENAERLRREGNYDKALALLESLIKISPNDADLYWAAVLCRYGVDFSGGDLRVQNVSAAKSLLSDEDFKSALKFADGEQRRLMESAAAKIDETRRKAAESENISLADVILICKNESVGAKIKRKLSGKYGVFYLRDENVSSANSARALIIYGDCKADFENETACAFAASERTVIPVLDGVEAEELPEVLRKFQAADARKLGWESDILSGLDALFGKYTSSSRPKSVEPMLRRIYILLEDGDFSGAERVADRLLEKEKNDVDVRAETYLAKLLCEFKVASENELSALSEDFTNSENYRFAMRFGSDGFRFRIRALTGGN